MIKKELKIITLTIIMVLFFTMISCGKKSESVDKLVDKSGITVYGTFEKESILEVKKQSVESQQGKEAIMAITKPYDSAKIAIFDIAITKNGKKVQPDGKVKITLPIPFEATNGYVTYHIKGEKTVEELSTTVNGDKISFETTSFSYFIVAGLVQADEQHIHSYVEKITGNNLVDEATCQRKAVYRLVCSICGNLGRETFEYGELASHNLREEKGHSPSCERPGLTHGKRCINYGCTYTEQEEIPALGHDMRDVEKKDPTCTEIGWKAYKRCNNYCGKTEGYEEIPATGHNMSIHFPRVEPTCEKWGTEEYYKCANEGCTELTAYKGIPALGHDKVVHSAKDPTCTEEGYWQSYDTCTRCDYTTNTQNNIREALGHLLEHHEAKEPDCLPGWNAYDICKRDECDYNTKVEIPANGNHSYVCDVCTTCGENNPIKYTRDGNYIYFGHWTQSCEKDETIIAKLLEIAGDYPKYEKDSNDNNWLHYEDAADIWYKDVIYNGVKYRGIVRNTTRWVGGTNCNYWSNSNGYGGTMYWFRFEPIKWRILTTTNNSAFLMSELALDFWAPQLEFKTLNTAISYNAEQGVPDGTYANNWEYTFIRRWLNETFYNDVFNDLQKEIIKITLVDNSVTSCNPNKNPKYFKDGENQFAAQARNTNDKIFLLSLQEITTEAYGFSKEMGNDSARALGTTDFARFQGLCSYLNEGRGDFSRTEGTVNWLTRSPYVANASYNKGLDVHTVRSGIYPGRLNVAGNIGGIVPALWITLE